MGLAIVQRIIDWQGGKIWFHPGPDDKGTVFRFTWNKAAQDMPEIEEPTDGGTAILKMLTEEEAQAPAVIRNDADIQAPAGAEAETASDDSQVTETVKET
jgi:hypothetical protein